MPADLDRVTADLRRVVARMERIATELEEALLAFRSGRRKGGRARAQALTKARRAEIASIAARARWGSGRGR
jgi:exonuclease VII small subunit